MQRLLAINMLHICNMKLCAANTYLSTDLARQIEPINWPQRMS